MECSRSPNCLVRPRGRALAAARLGHKPADGPRQRGFTLIELMIAVAIVGILATLAMGFYQGAMLRAHIAEGLMLVTPMKTVIHESLAFNPGADACTGVADITTPTRSVQSSHCIDDGSTATVHLVMTEKAGNLVLRFVSDRDGTRAWDCEPAPAFADVPYLPTTCR